MSLTFAAEGLMLETFRSVARYASLHTAEPGLTGAGELAGGEPPYVREAVDWKEPLAGTVSLNTKPIFHVPGGTVVSHVGFWSQPQGGTFLGSASITAERFNRQGTYTLIGAEIALG